MNLIVLAIPVFFLLIAVEVVLARLQARDLYRLSDSVNDLSCGILDQLLDGLLKAALLAGYVFLHERYRLFSFPPASPVVWAACFLGVDFIYYWFHRASHEVNALWAAHIVHHQSEEYNLTVALRQSAFQQAFSWVFYLPLAVLGFPPAVFLAVSAINTLYQFWIHTRTIGRLGPLEWVLSTPSNHRVHHGRNPRYVDRNHGGTLIVWDRLFGTYAREEDEPVYGITSPLRSLNPVWANLHYWADLLCRARRAVRLRDRLRYLVARPGWNPPELGGFQAPPEVDRACYRKFDVPVPRGLHAYVAVQFAAMLLLASWFLFSQEGLSLGLRAAVSAAVAFSLVALGGLLERKAWAPAAEAVRLGLLAPGAAWLLTGSAGPAVTALAAGAASLSWLARWREAFAGASGLDPRAEARP
jgi:sterol desaturase/sphingolipid hydroxylase (fatty acid hydroxylase superfamily)